MQAPKGRAVRESGGILPQKSFKSWSFEMPFLVFWEHNFCLKSSLNQLWFLCKIFICGASFMSIRFHLFLSVFKVFWCIRFCYVYPDTGMCSCISIIRILSKYWNRFQNRDFSYPDCITWSGFGIFKQILG